MKKQTVNSNNKSIMHRQASAAWLGGCLLSLGLVWAPPMLAAEVSCGAAPDIEGAGMNCFSPGTAAKSGEVNANFKYLLDEKNSLQQAVNTLQSDNANLQQAISTLQSDNANLLARLTALEVKLAAVSDSSTADLLLIEGANVQIVNGEGRTNSINSTGNLIIGYNEAATSEICSDGSYTTQTDCEANGGIWAANQRQGSHNVVIGDGHQYTRYSGFVTGVWNVINGKWASVSGGRNNTAGGPHASVSGGLGNTAIGNFASVSGGWINVASGLVASVSGGKKNTASGENTSVSGGYKNTASGKYASVSGGYNNNASGEKASVSGGKENTASGENASVSGGWINVASGENASVSGGYKNTASKLRSSVSGGSKNKADGEYSSILGGQNIEISTDYQTYPNP